jgi:hypothetical protein
LAVRGDRIPSHRGGVPDRLTGFEQVLDSEALDRIGLLETADRIVGFRGGFAVIRGEEIVDWIESPFWIV